MNSMRLYLSSNKIGEKGAESLSSALSQLKNLNSLGLYLNYNYIEEKGA